MTNYCGLILRLLYDESPRRFEALIKDISEGIFPIRTGPIFAQQHKLTESTPDLFIHQRAFSLLVETKLHDWFHRSQIQRHINGLKQFGGQALLLALSNFESDQYQRQFSERFQEDIAAAKSAAIHVVALSFEDLLRCLRSLPPPRRFRETLREFGRYLDGQGLLPRWRSLLDVVSCRQTPKEIALGAYICPDLGGSYSHRRAKYLGTYTGNRRVSAIHEIKGLVVLATKAGGYHVRWKNVEVENSLLIREAERVFAGCESWRCQENEAHALQFFLLGPGIPTDFKKETPGGMVHSKIYFRNIAKDVRDAQELATKLNGKKWGDFLK